VGLGIVHLIPGVLALRMHGWVNYAVALWATLWLALSLVAGDSKYPGNPSFVWAGMLIPGALLYYAIKNLSAWGKVKAASVSDEPSDFANHHSPLTNPPLTNPQFTDPPPNDYRIRNTRAR